MDHKIVCDYCGTIYNADKAVCPLCGNAPTEEARNRQRPAQRRRNTEEERRRKDRAARTNQQKASAQPQNPKRIPKKLLTASLIFLGLAVFVVTYFIGDVNGLWPGLSSVLNSDMRATTPSDEAQNKTCTFLEIQPENITFTQKGQIQKLRVVINAGCEETVSFLTSDDKTVNVSTQTQKTETQQEQTSITVDVSALAEGSATIQVTCGNKSRICHVTNTFGADATDPSAGSEPSAAAFTPQLNYEDVTLSLPRETVTIKVMNLPTGSTVRWESSDEKIAEVDADGKVTALSEGTAEITADVGGNTVKTIIRCDFGGTAENGSDAGTHLTHTDVSIAIGEEFNLRLIDGNGNRISGASYYVDDTDVCSVSGVTVCGEGRGTTEVTVKYNVKSYTCIVRVG